MSISLIRANTQLQWTPSGALDISGTRFTNASNGVFAQDLITKYQLDLSVTSAVSGTVNYLPKYLTANTLGDSILSDNGTTVSGTGRISMTDNTRGINVINARTAGVGSNAIRGYTSSSGYGVFGMCDGGGGAGFVGYGYKGSMAGFVYQGDALLASSTNATLLIQKNFTLGAYTATGALIDAGDYTASTGNLATWRKFSATLSATAIVGKLFTANDGRTVTERFYGYDTTASAWRYWDWATTTDSKLKLYYNNATTTCWESNGTAIKHTVTDAVTNAVTITSVVDHQSSGTPAEGFGGGLKFTLESSTTAERDAAQISTDWTDATDATRTSALRMWTVTSAGSLEERLSITGTEVVLNEVALDRDFRVESTGHQRAIHADASTNCVSFLDKFSICTGSVSVSGDVHLGVSGNVELFFVDNINRRVYLGGTTDGTYFETDGTMRMQGDATVWDDLLVEANTVKAGVSAPAWVAFGPSGSLQCLAFQSGQHDEVVFNIQLPHSYKEGSHIYPHIHWCPVNTTAGNVVWELEYSWANMGGVFTAVSNMATDPTAAGGTAWYHHITKFKSGGLDYIDGTDKTISSVLICRLHRNAGAGSDTLAANAAMLYFDIHYEKDSVGSRQELVK